MFLNKAEVVQIILVLGNVSYLWILKMIRNYRILSGLKSS
jgi:hypothetical protein